jgi:hypothetical protein
VLFLLLIAWFYARRFEKPGWYAFLVFLLFNSTFICYPLGWAFVIAYAYEIWCEKKAGKKFFLALAMMCFGAAVAWAQGLSMPPGHALYGTVMEPNYGRAFVAMAKALLPINMDLSNELAMFIGAVVFGTFLLSFANKPIPLFIASTSWAGLFYVFTFVHQGDVRHFGFVLVMLLVVLWISRSYRDENWIGALTKKLPKLYFDSVQRNALFCLNLCLLLSVKYAYVSHTMDYYYPFSGSRRMAEVIEMLKRRVDAFGDLVLVAYPSGETQSVLPYLPGMRFWYADEQEFGTYSQYFKKGKFAPSLTGDDVVVRAARRFSGLDRTLILLMGHPFEFSQEFGYDFKLIFETDHVFGYGLEKFYLYKPIPKPQ